MALRSISGLPDNDMDSDTVSGNGHRDPAPGPTGRELSYRESFDALSATMARLRAKHPHLFKTQADDEAGLAARRWDQR